MRKVRKYFYNTATNSFEKWVVPLRVRLLRVVGFVSASTVTGLLLASVAFRFLASPGEKASADEMQRLRENYTSLQQETKSLNNQLAELEGRDNELYRAVFNADPLPDSVREGKQYAVLARDRNRYRDTEDVIAGLRAQLKAMHSRMAMQARSYDTLEKMAHAKEEMLMRIPAIQPVSNKDLNRIASGYGIRIDPVYKTPKLHTGLDFAAPLGTPIYATAAGKVQSTAYDEGGYGNHVVIDHDFRHQTLYGHMIKIKVRPGEVVQRGQLIGWVGSTGKSTGPHCHYEVIRNGEKVDPIHYFFNDLSAPEYDRLVKVAAAQNQALD